MKAIIPVAGTGTRLKPFTSTVPKPLLPVAGKPILAHLLDNLTDLGIDRFIFVIGYMGDKIRQFAETNYPDKSDFVEQTSLLGLGYAVKLGLELCSHESVLVALGDTIFETNIPLNCCTNSNIIGIHRVEDPRRFGVIELLDDRIIGMEEKPQVPKSDMAMAGFYLFNDSSKIAFAIEKIIETEVRTRGEIQLTDAMALMLSEGEIFLAREIESWHDCGTVETLLQTNEHLLKKVITPPSSYEVLFIPPVYVGKGAKLDRSVIGPNVSIGEGATIEDSIISNSIVGNGSSIRFAHLVNSILGNEAVYLGRCEKMILGDHSEGGFYNNK